MSDATKRVPRREGLLRNIAFGARLMRDTAGNVMPLMAIGTVVLAALVGGGVDMARSYKAERRLQAACDAGALAGRRAVTSNGFNTAAQTQANAFFNANYSATEQGTSNPVFTPTSPDDGDTVNGHATATINTVIMRIFGFRTLNLDVTCSASMGVGNSDIMFVLDNTKSMDWEPQSDTNPSYGEQSRMDALREAMKSFYDTVETSSGGGNARIRYGFVPYATTVNVGQLLYNLNASYIADSITVPSVAFVNWNPTPINTWSDPNVTHTSSSGVTNWANVSGVSRYNSDSACQSALPANTAWTNYGTLQTDSVSYSVNTSTGNQVKAIGQSQEQRRTEYRCNNRYRQSRTATRDEVSTVYEERAPSTTNIVDNGETFADAILQQRTFNVSTYKTFASTTVPVGVNSSGTLAAKFNSTTTWGGCIQERQTTPAATFSFVSLLEGIVPDNGETALDLDIDSAPTNDINTKWAPLWPEVTYERDYGKTYQGLASNTGTISRNTITGKQATSYCPYHAQLMAEMDEGDFDDYVDAMSTNNYGTYHDTGLLWGARLSSPTGIFSGNVNEAADNGGTVSRHVIFMTDGDPQPDLEVNGMYGIENVLRRITGTSPSEQTSRHQNRAAAICEAIKARGIRLWVIGFGHGVSDFAALEACASPDSAFQAADSAELEEAFQEIATQVGELRITQ